MFRVLHVPLHVETRAKKRTWRIIDFTMTTTFDSEEKSTATDSTVQGAELLRAGGKGERRPVLSPEGVLAVPNVLADASCLKLVPEVSESLGYAPLVVKAPTEAGEVTAEAIRGETFMPIRALLPVWTDPLTGKPLDVEQLRKALMGLEE